MLHIYLRATLLFTISTILISAPLTSRSQCAHGYVPSGVAFDTTINFLSGRVFAELKFPKFDPQLGMVTCARLTMEMSSTMENLTFENRNFLITNTAEADFTREDTLSGPGLTTPLLNSESKTYGPYTLGPRDVDNNAGDDFVQVGPELIFTSSVTKIITNVADLSEFYGPVGDSLVYNYNVDSKTTTNVTGNWVGGAETSGSVTYRLEYCYCPIESLPVNVYDFKAKKIDNDKAMLSWKGTADKGTFYYEIEFSEDGSNFTPVAVVEKQTSGSGFLSYNYLYAAADMKKTCFFRIKQNFLNGKKGLSDIRSIDFEQLGSDQVSLYPNPSDGIIGIKFDKYTTGKILVSITNVQGQIVFNKQLEISDNKFRQVTRLERGMYWVRIKNESGSLSYVTQLLIK